MEKFGGLWIEHCGKWILGAVSAMMAFFHPVNYLIGWSLIAIGVDFIIGNWANWKLCRRNKVKYMFQSDKMWDTIEKAALTAGGIVFCWVIDHFVLDMDFGLPKVFAAFIIGTEFWSYLENASVICNWSAFRNSKKIIAREIENRTNIKIDENENR